MSLLGSIPSIPVPIPSNPSSAALPIAPGLIIAPVTAPATLPQPAIPACLLASSELISCPAAACNPLNPASVNSSVKPKVTVSNNPSPTPYKPAIKSSPTEAFLISFLITS